MSTPATGIAPAMQARRGREFCYESYATDPASGLLTCSYSVDGRRFEERITLSPAGNWESPAVAAAARLVFLLAGVSYYKTAAPPVIRTGQVALTCRERAFLREFYLHGLGEFGYRNGIDLSGLRIEGPDAGGEPPAGGVATAAGSSGRPGAREAGPRRALVPFGGGIDSIVTVELVRHRADAALFVVSRPGDLFDAIERPAAVTGLPVVRAAREIDPQLLRSRELGFLNGHVPVTGILSAIAIMVAALEGRDAVVMSNEWSASVPTVEAGDRTVNHQYSKSAEFEAAFREVLEETTAGLPAGVGMPDYFSALRPRTELWIAERFARLEEYHGTFRSCNRAFHIDKAQRLDHWCGQCDKCCFIDLILAPFLPAAELEHIFGGREPLADPSLAGRFRALLGTSDGSKPFECVGEVNECRAATLLAARRPDRAACELLDELAAEVMALPGRPSTEGLLRPIGEHFIPAAYAEDLLD
jgi:UDP-N-acetyl-alpha-D-muramoyl-L-alanyl-L-glutamate epimerase